MGTREPQPPKTGTRLAGWLLAVQVVVIVGFVVFYVVELASGQGEDRTRVVMSCVVFLIMAAGLGVLTRGLLRNASWSRTPTVLWNALLVPVGISLIQAAQVWVGVVVMVAAVGTIGAVLAARRGDQADPASL